MESDSIKTVSTSQRFSEKFGGKWKYHFSGTWFCDDGIRYINRVATGIDHNGEYTGESSFCMYFRDGRTPEWVY